MFYLPIKKFICVVTRRYNHSKPYQPLETPRPLKKTWLLFILLVPAVYYIVTVVVFSSPGTLVQYMMAAETGNANKNGSRKQRIIYFRETTEAIPMSEATKRLGLPVCVVNYTELGRISDMYKRKAKRRKKIRMMNTTRTAIYGDKCFTAVKKGGQYSPPNCISRHKVAVLVPYRNRPVNLAVFIFNIHPFLITQKLEYRIFVLEQYGNDTFNKGRLYNAGFRELKKYGKWKCVIFHDVDLIPLDDRILYTCPIYPRHMCGTVTERKKDPSYHVLFGGVTSMSVEHYEKVNGYSNMYWGWGGEDNDMFWRLRAARIPVVRYNKTIAEYTALPHTIHHRNKHRFQLLHTAMERYKDEGLSTVEYKIKDINLRHLYTHIFIDVNPYNENTTVLSSAVG